MDNQKENENDKGSWKNQISIRQSLCVLVIACTSFIIGLLVGWTALLPKLQEDERFNVTDEDVTWLVSLVLVVGCVVSPIVGPLGELIGLRRLMLLGMLPVTGFFLLQAFAPVLSIIYVARVGLAVSNSIACTLVQPLVAELCPAKVRGIASTIPEIITCIGMLGGYLLAYFLPWNVATAASAAPFLPLSLVLLLVPESPYWLVRKKRIDEAEKSLRRLTGREDVTKELELIRSTTTMQQGKVMNQVKELRKKQNALPVLVMLSVFILRELGGKGPVFNYTVYMFRRAGVEMDAFYCTVFVGVARLVGTCLSSCMLDLIGRRPLLIGTAVICAMSEGVAGGLLYLEVEGATWLPLASVLMYVVAYGVGLGPIPWTYCGELLPTPVRSIGASMMSFSYAITYFAVNYVFLKAISGMGLGLTFIIFGSANFIIALIVLFFIPETKGRTLQDMETAFASKNSETGVQEVNSAVGDINTHKDKSRGMADTPAGDKSISCTETSGDIPSAHRRTSKVV